MRLPNRIIYVLLSLLCVLLLAASRAEDLAEEAEIREVNHLEAKPPHREEFVLKLTDQTFEHTTQASTGQTTGSWIVWFHTADDDETAFVGEMPEESWWLEHHVLPASVDVKAGGSGTSSRLEVKSLPSFLLIHKGKMYRYPNPNGSYSWEAIARFCVDPPADLAEDVAAPPSLWNHLAKKMRKDKQFLVLASVIVMVVVSGLAVAAFIGHFGGPKEKEA
jgi:hypothetical protein